MTDALAKRAAHPERIFADGAADHSEGMSYLHSLPRRLITLYLPLGLILLVLLFPFYWMALTAIKPDNQLLDLETYSPFWTWNPTLKHIQKLLFDTEYPIWLWNTMLVAVCATALSIIASVLAAYAIVRLRYKGARWVGGAIFLAYLVPPSILFIPLSTVVYQYGLFDTPFALILTYPTILIPFSTWLLMGYFKTIPYELEECALIDGASRWQIFHYVALPIARPGIAVAFILSVIFSWNNFVFGIVLAGRETRTLPVAVYNMISFDQLSWGPLAAAALIVTLPVLLLTVFAQRQIVAGLTAGAVKGG
jgi:multiple sugar transport system permease protein